MTLAPARKAMLTGGASGFGRDEASSLTGFPPTSNGGAHLGFFPGA
jgi:hypothetical protein